MRDEIAIQAVLEEQKNEGQLQFENIRACVSFVLTGILGEDLNLNCSSKAPSKS